MTGTIQKSRKILVNEDKLLGVRCIDRPIGAKIGVQTCPPDCICYLRGTRIRTPEGERRIEELKIGDLVVTLSGESKQIKWIGRQRFESERWQVDWEPVRIGRFALDERSPHRDLYVSPNHAIYVDGVLIPAKYLVNGTSIVQAMPEGVENIDYFHIELETHEVIFAEGAAAESLLITNDRETFVDLTHDKFDNFVEHERLYTAKGILPMTPYAPRVCYNGRRSELKALLRRAVSPVVDMRDPIQLVHDRIAARGAELENQLVG